MNNSLNKTINYKNLIGFAIPTIISNVFMSIYMTIDGIFVSNFDWYRCPIGSEYCDAFSNGFNCLRNHVSDGGQCVSIKKNR